MDDDDDGNDYDGLLLAIVNLKFYNCVHTHFACGA